jgi:hypothetical protein
VVRAVKVIQVKPGEGWTRAGNSVVRNKVLSWRARGLLWELLSYPADNDVTLDKLVAAGRAAGGNAEGREAMRRAMRELEDVGHVRYATVHGKGGRWETTVEVCNVPGLLGGPTGAQDPVSRKAGRRETGRGSSGRRNPGP